MIWSNAFKTIYPLMVDQDEAAFHSSGIWTHHFMPFMEDSSWQTGCIHKQELKAQLWKRWVFHASDSNPNTSEIILSLLVLTL